MCPFGSNGKTQIEFQLLHKNLPPEQRIRSDYFHLQQLWWQDDIFWEQYTYPYWNISFLSFSQHLLQTHPVPHTHCLRNFDRSRSFLHQSPKKNYYLSSGVFCQIYHCWNDEKCFFLHTSIFSLFDAVDLNDFFYFLQELLLFWKLRWFKRLLKYPLMILLQHYFFRFRLLTHFGCFFGCSNL